MGDVIALGMSKDEIKIFARALSSARALKNIWPKLDERIHGYRQLIMNKMYEDEERKKLIGLLEEIINIQIGEYGDLKQIEKIDNDKARRKRIKHLIDRQIRSIDRLKKIEKDIKDAKKGSDDKKLERNLKDSEEQSEREKKSFPRTVSDIEKIMTGTD